MCMNFCLWEEQKAGTTGGKAADEPVGSKRDSTVSCRLLFGPSADRRFFPTTHAQTPPQFPLLRGQSEGEKETKSSLDIKGGNLSPPPE